MSRPDELRHRTAVRDNLHASGEEERPPSKTRRKAAMHALQDIGVALVELETRQFNAFVQEVELPENLRDALAEARGIRAHGGRKRQLQYIGKLMREVDAQPITQWLDRLAHGQREGSARQHALERWRDRLLDEPDALDRLMAEHPTLDRPRLRALITKARTERAEGSAPHAYRDLFRALKAILKQDEDVR
ncbi:MAG TPA: ribosome biogenesis factor YjgA [Casimicrobiaceae bacterium]|nr:ribosome biogenesis factor YjgA [Casimicrobiaceae bacterium]